MPRLKTKISAKPRLRNSFRLIITGATLVIILSVGWLLVFNVFQSKKGRAEDQNIFTGYGWRKKVSISKLSETAGSTILNVPLLIHLSDPDFRHISKGGKVISQNAADISFGKTDGKTQLHAEIEKYNPSTGELSAWILFDSIAGNKAQEFHVYYSRPSIANQKKISPWAMDYKGVWHFNSGIFPDKNYSLPTFYGTAGVPGKIGEARKFRSDARDFASIVIPETPGLNDRICVSAWILPDFNGKEQTIVSCEGETDGGFRLFINKSGNAVFDFIREDGMHVSSADVPGGKKAEFGKWNLITAIYSSKEKILSCYVNGVLSGELATNDKPSISGLPLQVGRMQFRDDSYFNGLIDELRISDNVFPPERIKLEYLNQMEKKQAVTGPPEQLLIPASQVKEIKKNLSENADFRGANQEMYYRHQQGRASEASISLLTENEDWIIARMSFMRSVAGKQSSGK